MGSFHVLHKLITDDEAAYIFGLWCADGYFWSSSIGITNVDRRLIDRFRKYIQRYFPEHRIKLRSYRPAAHSKSADGGPSYALRLAKQTAFQLYVDSRPLLRLFQDAEKQVALLRAKYILPYIAGRFDGDGSVDKDMRKDLRICYSNKTEAETDARLLTNRYKVRVYRYRAARTFILYISRLDASAFLSDIAPYSIKVQSLLPRRDSSQQRD